MQNLNERNNFNDFLVDKQQEFDLPSMRVEEISFEIVEGIGDGTVSNQQQSGRSYRGPPMSQISGVKRPLSHTNSFAGERLPTYGVETPHELPLGQQLADVDTWGTDIFKIADLSNNRPLTSIAFVIFKVTKNEYVILNPRSVKFLCAYRIEICWAVLRYHRRIFLIL